MFDGYRIKKRSMAAYRKIIVPEQKGYRPVLFQKAPHDRPIKKRWVFRFAVCMLAGITLAGIAVFQRAGLPFGGPVKGPAVGLPEGAGSSFTLVAYAAAADGTEKTPGVNIDRSTRVVLPPDVRVKLPFGKIERDRTMPSQKAEGTVLYPYRFPADSFFHFEGSELESITLTARSGTLFVYEKQADRFPATGYGPGKPAAVSPDGCIGWHLDYAQMRKILQSADFTDFKSIPPDEIRVDVKLRDSTVRHETLILSFADDGSLVSKLSGDGE